MGLFFITIFGPVMLLVGVPTAIYASIVPTPSVSVFRSSGAILATLGLWSGILVTSTGCSPYFMGILLAPLSASGAAIIALALPRTRKVNVILIALAISAPIVGLALGHVIHTGPGDCP